MAQQFPEQEYLIDRLIPDSSITILSGASGSFKTYTLLEMALSIASGKPLFSQFAAQQAGVLIIDEENGERLMQKRLKQLGAADDLPIYFTPKMGFELTDDNVENIILSCKTYGIKLIVIDSLIRIHSAEENSSKEMAKVFKQLRRFTEQDIAVLVTQHNRKQGNFNGGVGNEMRGSSEIRAAIDSQLGVIRKKKWYLTFDQSKQRYDVELEPFQVKVNANEQEFSFEYLGAMEVSQDKEELILEEVLNILQENQYLNQGQLLERLEPTKGKTNEHTLRTLLAQWQLEGTIPAPKKGNGKEKLYHLEVEPSYE